MRITSAGNVGIGISSPAAKLEVSDAGQITRFTSTSTTLYCTYRANGTDVGYIGNGVGVASGGSATDFGFNSVNNMIFTTTGATERMRITSTGNVGIGTTSPASKLHLQGTGTNITITDTTYSRTSNIGYLDNANLYLANDSASNTYIGRYNSVFLAYGGGSVGIGTSSPSAKLDVYGNMYVGDGSNTTNIYLRGITGTSWAWNINNLSTGFQIISTQPGATSFNIASSGNVGIGTSSPAELLNVNGGNFRLNGSNANSKLFIYNNYSGGAVGVSMVNTSNVSVIDFNANVGSGVFAGNVTAAGFFNSSDIRLKEVVNVIYDPSKIAAITYKWKDGRDNKNHVGYSAQEVQKYMPDAVNEDEKGFLSVDYIQVLVAKIDALEKRVKELEGK
jgi:hypothetical protein